MFRKRRPSEVQSPPTVPRYGDMKAHVPSICHEPPGSGTAWYPPLMIGAGALGNEVIKNLALMGVGLLALIRGSADVLRGNVLYPWARYAFPAILPTALLLCAGWLEGLERIALRFRLAPLVRDGIFFGLMLGISLLGIFNAVRLFHPAWWSGGVFPGMFTLVLAIIFYLYVRFSPRPGPLSAS